MITYRQLRSEEFTKALQLRIKVFVDEQKVPLAEENDSFDKIAQHYGVFQGEHLIGTGRLVVQNSVGKIGRVAILPQFRGLGFGSNLIRFILDCGKKQEIKEFVLGSQVQAIPFYSQLGFQAEGKVFQDGGIPHRIMRYQVDYGEEVRP